MLQIGQTAPDFTARDDQGPIRFHEWIGNSWACCFPIRRTSRRSARPNSAPWPICKPEFDKRGTKIIGLSVDPVDSHAKWAKDIEETQGTAPNYPMIGDTDLSIAKAYGMLPAATPGGSEGRTAADNQTVRTVFVIAPDKSVKLQLAYPMTTGRNFDEVLRVIDSLQLTAKHKVATPANWKNGDDVIIAGSVSNEEAEKRFPRRLEDAETLSARRRAAEINSRAVVTDYGASPLHIRLGAIAPLGGFVVPMA